MRTILFLVVVVLGIATTSNNVLGQASVPVVTTDSAKYVNPFAKFYGTYVSDTVGIYYWFEYGTDSLNLSNSTTTNSSSSLSANVLKVVSLNLSPDSTYYCRFCVTNFVGVSCGLKILLYGDIVTLLAKTTRPESNIAEVVLLDLTGRIVKHFIPPGIYIYQKFDKDKILKERGKMVIY